MPRKRINYIYKNEGDGFWFKVRAFLHQLFKGKGSKDKIEERVVSDLEYIETEKFEDYSPSEKYSAVFEKFLSEEKKKSEIGLKDIKDIANELKPRNPDLNNPCNFATLISNPLERLCSMEKGSEEYEAMLSTVLDNTREYINAHNPYSKEGKRRLEFAMRLRFMAEKEIDEDAEEFEEESELDEDEVQEEINSIENDTRLIEQVKEERIEINNVNENEKSVEISNEIENGKLIK